MNPYIYPILKKRPVIRRLNKMEAIMKLISNYTGVTITQIQGRSRNRPIVYARHLFCSLARKYSGATVKAIGEQIDRDHTSVLHGMQTISDLSDTEFEVREDVKKLCEQIETLLV